MKHINAGAHALTWFFQQLSNRPVDLFFSARTASTMGDTTSSHFSRPTIFPLIVFVVRINTPSLVEKLSTRRCTCLPPASLNTCGTGVPTLAAFQAGSVLAARPESHAAATSAACCLSAEARSKKETTTATSSQENEEPAGNRGGE